MGRAGRGILLLHGYNQSAQVIKQKATKFCEKTQKAGYEVVTGDGVFVAKQRRQWWSSEAFRPDVEQSLQFLNKIAENSSITSVVGYSQGGALAAIISAIHDRKSDIKRDDFPHLFSSLHSVVLLSAFRTKIDHFHAKVEISLPSLHVMSADDKVVSIDSSMLLADCFVNKTIIKHSMGHSFPDSDETTKQIVDWIVSTDQMR